MKGVGGAGARLQLLYDPGPVTFDSASRLCTRQSYIVCSTAVILHWEGRMKTGPKWAVNRSQYVPLQTCLYQHFFFKRPYLGNETRFCKCVSGKTTPTDGAFTHSFMKVTSPNSFILFRPLSWKKALFWGVPVGPNWATLVQNMPLGPLSIMQKRTDSGKPNWSFAGMFCDLFHFSLFQPFSLWSK